jgi:acyl-coenzyme A thioesterase PaaI-like protein
MPESFQTRLARWRLNCYPCYRGSGAWVIFIATDWREVHVKLPLSWQTRNVVGTIFGGSIYASVDPIYMLMLIRNLGQGYTVWDKAASIRFIKPGHSTLYARFYLDDEELRDIRVDLEQQPSVDRIYSIDLKDADGNVSASVEKTIYIARSKQ